MERFVKWYKNLVSICYFLYNKLDIVQNIQVFSILPDYWFEYSILDRFTNFWSAF